MQRMAQASERLTCCLLLRCANGLTVETTAWEGLEHRL